jgi:hypothetical protein
MSAATPDHICRAIWNNARGIGIGPVVKRSEYQRYMEDLGGWFSYWGDVIDIKAKSLGGGMYAMKGTKR